MDTLQARLSLTAMPNPPYLLINEDFVGALLEAARLYLWHSLERPLSWGSRERNLTDEGIGGVDGRRYLA